MQSYWIKGLEQRKNATVAFRKTFAEKTRMRLRIAGVSCYKIIADGKLIGFGPYRAAHGQSKILTFSFDAKCVVVEANCYNVKTYWIVKEPPFIALELFADKRKYSLAHFESFILCDRVSKVQRYSFQRGFLEAYNINSCDRYAFYNGAAVFALADTFMPASLVKVKGNALSVSNLSHPTLETVNFGEPVEYGTVQTDLNKSVWRNRSIRLINQIGGYKISEWQVAPTDEVSRFVYREGASGERSNGGLSYRVYGNGIALTGFFKVTVRVKNAGSLWLVYDELDFKEDKNNCGGKINVCFSRNTCANVIKWQFNASGEFTLDSFEPYTAGYIKAVFDGGIEICDISLVKYENPDCCGFFARIDCEKTQKIVDAAVSTFSQNAVDILTDCPSRERAGWLSDSYFTSEVEYLLTGKNAREKAFLQNYANHKQLSRTPDIVPMCYPADDYEGLYIPNWALWYVLELDKYRKRYGKGGVVKNSLNAVRSVMRFFEKYENEFGLLENLQGWVFVEWSAANNKKHTAGLNVPSNALYYAALKAAAALLNDQSFAKKAEAVKNNLLRLAYDGNFFVDNLIRNAQGELVKTQNYTEVCQYYLFYFKVASVKKFSKTYSLLMNELGVRRKRGTYKQIGKCNAMYGIYMRLELLLREKNTKELYRECTEYFYPMAARTGTLWENASPSGSNVHGFASYVLKWLIYSLTGYDGKKMQNVTLASAASTVDFAEEAGSASVVGVAESAGAKVKFVLPKNNCSLVITVKNGVASVEKI